MIKSNQDRLKLLEMNMKAKKVTSCKLLTSTMTTRRTETIKMQQRRMIQMIQREEQEMLRMMMTMLLLPLKKMMACFTFPYSI